MISLREHVSLSGTHKVVNHEAPCTVRGLKVSLPHLDIREYVSADVNQAPAELPDGTYDVRLRSRR